MRRTAALLVASLLVLPILSLVPAARATDVPGGVITGPTQWTRAGSPYILGGNVTVSGGLEIGPGVEVLFAGNYSLTSVGAAGIYANGSATEPVVFRARSAGGVGAWGVLNLAGGHDCRILQSMALIFALRSPFERCIVEDSYGGLHIDRGSDGRIANVTIRHSTLDGLDLAGTLRYTVSDVLVDHAGIGLALTQVGTPLVTRNPTENDLHHITLSNVTYGVVVRANFYPGPATNRLTMSVIREAGTAFSSALLVHVFGNNVLNNVRDFGSGFGGVGLFDDGARGNHWSAYTGTDANQDGIGDTPYGPDRYPLMDPVSDAGAHPSNLPVVPGGSSFLGPAIVALLIMFVAVAIVTVIVVSRRRIRRSNRGLPP